MAVKPRPTIITRSGQKKPKHHFDFNFNEKHITIATVLRKMLHRSGELRYKAGPRDTKAQVLARTNLEAIPKTLWITHYTQNLLDDRQ